MKDDNAILLLSSTDEVVGVNAERKAQLEKEFNVYLCSSQKWLVLVQAVYYSVIALGQTASSIGSDMKVGEYPLEFWIKLGLICDPDAPTCPILSNTTYFQELEVLLLKETAVFGVISAVQAITFITVAVIIHRRSVQEKWLMWSSILMAIAAFCGPVWADYISLNNWIYNGYGLSNLTAIPQAVFRANMFQAVLSQRSCRQVGLTGLQLLTFAPRCVGKDNRW